MTAATFASGQLRAADCARVGAKPDLARRGWEYYAANRIWHPNAEISLEGLKFTMEIYAEQTKGLPPDPVKYIDMSFLQQAIRELGDK